MSAKGDAKNEAFAKALGYESWAEFKEGHHDPATEHPRGGTTTRLVVPLGTDEEGRLKALKARIDRDRLPGTPPMKGLTIEKATPTRLYSHDPKGHEAWTVLISWTNPYYDGGKS